MRSEVRVKFQGREFNVGLDGLPTQTNEQGRRWLDEQFAALGCEPLRPPGKLLLADKVVLVAQAAGVDRFADEAWAQTFAAAAAATLSKPVIRVDVPGLTVSY